MPWQVEDKGSKARRSELLKWVYYKGSENTPTTFHGKEGREGTLFSKIVRHVREAPARLRKFSGGGSLRTELRLTHCYRARFPDSSGRIESQIKRGQRAKGIRSKVAVMIVIRRRVSIKAGEPDPEGTWKWLGEHAIQKGKTHRQAANKVIIQSIQSKELKEAEGSTPIRTENLLSSFWTWVSFQTRKSQTLRRKHPAVAQ